MATNHKQIEISGKTVIEQTKAFATTLQQLSSAVILN